MSTRFELFSTRLDGREEGGGGGGGKPLFRIEEKRKGEVCLFEIGSFDVLDRLCENNSVSIVPKPLLFFEPF